MQSSLARIAIAAFLAVLTLATLAGWVLYRATLEREQIGRASCRERVYGRV